jgi:hypothetical protein
MSSLYARYVPIKLYVRDEKLNIITSRNSFIIHCIRNIFRLNLRSFKDGIFSTKQIICIVDFYEILRSAPVFQIEDFESPAKKYRRESSDYKFSSILMNSSCDISTQKCNSELYWAMQLSQRNSEKQQAQRFTTISHKRLVAMIFSFWPVHTY